MVVCGSYGYMYGTGILQDIEPCLLPRPTSPLSSAHLCTPMTHICISTSKIYICLLLICGCVLCDSHNEELCGGMFLECP